MAALNSTVPSVLARIYVFVITDAITGTRRRGKEGGKQTAKFWAHIVESCST